MRPSIGSVNQDVEIAHLIFPNGCLTITAGLFDRMFGDTVSLDDWLRWLVEDGRAKRYSDKESTAKDRCGRVLIGPDMACVLITDPGCAWPCPDAYFDLAIPRNAWPLISEWGRA